MKSQIIFFLAFSSIVFSCRKIKDGEVSALKNGEPWMAELDVIKFPKNACDDCMSIAFTTYSPEGYERDLINLGWIPRKEGIYYFSDVSFKTLADSLIGTYSQQVSDGDVNVSLYYAVANDPNSFVEITKITGRRVKGRFQMTAILDSIYKAVDPTLPDTIQFLEGEFESD